MINNRLQVVGGAQAQGLTLSTATQKARVPRYPKHTFSIVQRPYEVTPFHISPVLSGETLKNLLMQARAVSTPLENPLIGHHLEHYFFYVRLRDLSDADDLVKMLMDADATAGVDKAASDNVYHYVKAGAPNYVKMCLDSVVKHYFRDEGDTASHVGAATGLPLAQWTNYKSLIESMIKDADIETDTTSSGTPFGEYEKEWQTWTFMRQMQLTEISFEDYLGTFGVRVPDAELNRPELIRMIKNWTYPTNTLDGDGTINSQASWSIQERADKDRFFKEPGFIFGVTIHRPKLYNAVQDQSGVSVLSDAFAWLPAMMKDDPSTSLKQMLGNNYAMPLISDATGSAHKLKDADKYWVDVRDLFLHGDQFVNHVPAADVNNNVPAQDIQSFHGKKYPDSATLQLIGKGDTLTVRQDGVTSLNILGTQIEST